MMKVPRTSPNNDESTPNNAEQEGTLGKVLVVMAWGLWACVRGQGSWVRGDIPFLADVITGAWSKVLGHGLGVLVVMAWGLWACVRGLGFVVMAWGCGDIPFLADGNYGVMVESPGSCDGISLNS